MIIYFIITAPASRSFSTWSTANKQSVLLHSNTTQHTQSAIRAAHRGDPRRRFMCTASAIAISAFFFANCAMTVYASNFLFRDQHKSFRRSLASANLPEYKSSFRSNKIDYSSLRGGDIIDQSDVIDVLSKTTPPIEFAHGTTTLSFVFQGGIVAAVDSRAR